MAASGTGGGEPRRHRARPNRSGGLLRFAVLATVTALALTFVGVILVAALFDQHDSKDARSAGGPSSSASQQSGHSVPDTKVGQSASATPSVAGTDGTAACLGEVAAADAEVAAAKVGIGHWTEHIQARSDLLAGRQPKAVTAAIWKRTREAGPTDLTRYRQAVAVHTQRSGACARAAGTSASPELAACRKRLQLLGKAITAGAAGMGDWKAHQDAMAAHKAGEIDAAHAQTMWVAAWAAAPKNINAFHTATTALRAAPPCQSLR